MGRTANWAAKRLPEKARPEFLRAWKACGCMDLYDGNLATYLRVVAQVIERHNEDREELKKLSKTIQKKLRDLRLTCKNIDGD